MSNPNGSAKSISVYRDPDPEAGGGKPLIKGNFKGKAEFFFASRMHSPFFLGRNKTDLD